MNCVLIQLSQTWIHLFTQLVKHQLNPSYVPGTGTVIIMVNKTQSYSKEIHRRDTQAFFFLKSATQSNKCRAVNVDSKCRVINAGLQAQGIKAQSMTEVKRNNNVVE